MATADVREAAEFVAQLELPQPPPPSRFAVESTQRFLDKAKDQAAVVGSDIISFVKGVSEERRKAVLDSALLAQLVAKRKIGDPKKIYDWYETYFDVLGNIGWVIQDRGFADYTEESQGFEAHEAILDIATSLLGPGTATLAVVKATLDSLKALQTNSPWITLFNRESRHANTARFQVSLAHEGANRDFLVTLMAFGLEAGSNITQVLFFKFRSNNAVLRHFSGKVTINADLLTAIQPKIAEKIAAFQSDFVQGLPDLG